MRITASRLLLFSIALFFIQSWVINDRLPKYRPLYYRGIDSIFVNFEYFVEMAKRHISIKGSLPEINASAKEVMEILREKSGVYAETELSEDIVSYIRQKSLLDDMDVISILSSHLINSMNKESLDVHPDAFLGSQVVFFIKKPRDEFYYLGCKTESLGNDNQDYVDVIISMREGYYFENHYGDLYQKGDIVMTRIKSPINY